MRECQGVQMARFIADRHDVATPAVVTGDFNESPDTFVYNQFVGRGWTDVYLAAGNPECDPTTGIGCTSGRNDEDLSHLESPASNEVERIDFIFAVPPASGSLCAASIDSGDDTDGDGTATRIFADDPNPFAPTCGPAPAADLLAVGSRRHAIGSQLRRDEARVNETVSSTGNREPCYRSETMNVAGQTIRTIRKDDLIERMISSR